jgi:hypothetical protein
LGGYKHAREEEIINQLRIGYILNAAIECTNRFPEKVPDFSFYPIKCNFLSFFFLFAGISVSAQCINHRRRSSI